MNDFKKETASRISSCAEGTDRNVTDDRSQPTGTFESYFRDSWQRVEKLVEQYPKTFLAMPLALGIGTGLCIGIALGGSSLFHHRADERLGERMFDYLAKRLPDSITGRFHS